MYYGMKYLYIITKAVYYAKFPRDRNEVSWGRDTLNTFTWGTIWTIGISGGPAAPLEPYGRQAVIGRGEAKWTLLPEGVERGWGRDLGPPGMKWMWPGACGGGQQWSSHWSWGTMVCSFDSWRGEPPCLPLPSGYWETQNPVHSSHNLQFCHLFPSILYLLL